MSQQQKCDNNSSIRPAAKIRREETEESEASKRQQNDTDSSESEEDDSIIDPDASDESESGSNSSDSNSEEEEEDNEDESSGGSWEKELESESELEAIPDPLDMLASTQPSETTVMRVNRERASKTHASKIVKALAQQEAQIEDHFKKQMVNTLGGFEQQQEKCVGDSDDDAEGDVPGPEEQNIKEQENGIVNLEKSSIKVKVERRRPAEERTSQK
jgi:hypothetical protein